MSEPQEHIEKLIARKLDGMLTEDEALELDRILIRSPEARQMYEEYRRIDDLAAQSLASLFPEGEMADIGGVPSIPWPADEPARRPRSYHKVWWTLTGLAAACLAALLYLNPSPPGPTNGKSNTGNLVANTHPATGGAGLGGAKTGFEQRAPVVPVGFSGGVTDRHVDREWIGVRGNDGNIYWLEVTRTRTSKRPGGGSGFKLTNFDL